MPADAPAPMPADAPAPQPEPTPELVIITQARRRFHRHDECHGFPIATRGLRRVSRREALQAGLTACRK